MLARLEAKGLSLSPPAARRTLLRRLSLDLVGLPVPPTMQGVALRECLDGRVAWPEHAWIETGAGTTRRIGRVMRSSL